MFLFAVRFCDPSLAAKLHDRGVDWMILSVSPSLFVSTYTARVAVVKSRDMHWSLLAQRDQRDISLSSLRMLIVADGANPCESTC